MGMHARIRHRMSPRPRARPRATSGMPISWKGWAHSRGNPAASTVPRIRKRGKNPGRSGMPRIGKRCGHISACGMPTFTNGAPCYLMHRDAGYVEEACRTGRLQLRSKHVIASAEYIPLIVAALSDDRNMFWDTECFFFRRTRRPDKVYWYEYHEYMWQLLSFELAATHLALADFCRITGWGRHE